MTSDAPKTGGELFIVDNSDEAWKGLRYLQEWTEIASACDEPAQAALLEKICAGPTISAEELRAAGAFELPVGPRRESKHQATPDLFADANLAP